MAVQKRRKKVSRRKVSRRTKNTFKQNVSKLFKLLFLLIVSGFIVWYFIFRSPGKSDLAEIPLQPKKLLTFLSESKSDKTASGKLTRTGKINKKLNDVFNKWELSPTWVVRKGKTVTVRLPRQILSIVMIQEIINEMERLKCTIKNSKEDYKSNRSSLEIEYNKVLLHKIVFIQERRLSLAEGKIAIIIDDFGYERGEHVTKLLKSPYNFTIAVLPDVPNSRQFYQDALKFNKETLIHMPMEALTEKVDYTDYTIFANMPDSDIRERINKAIKAYPESKGINNHMGSRITADKEIMRIILEEIKKNNRYFIDSRTTDKSVAFQTARELGVPSLQSNLFIEKGRNDSEAYLRDKLEVLKKVAKTKGYAVAIGHPYKNTVKVLLEEIPKLQDQGFALVPVSELLK